MKLSPSDQLSALASGRIDDVTPEEKQLALLKIGERLVDQVLDAHAAQGVEPSPLQDLYQRERLKVITESPALEARIRILRAFERNLTQGGLSRNTECNVILPEDDAHEALSCFETYWSESTPLAPGLLDDYQRKYSARIRISRSEVLQALHELTASWDEEESAILPSTAGVVWVGLQSVTGDYTYQVEFPKKLADATRALIGAAGDKTVKALCEDGVERDMQFSWYEQNGMYRVNVPNDTPGVELARAEKRGVLVLSRKAGHTLEARIEFDGGAQDSHNARSRANGSWGRTPTREYGWY